jgi:uncharacterized protein
MRLRVSDSPYPLSRKCAFCAYNFVHPYLFYSASRHKAKGKNMKCPVCETVDLKMSERQGVEIDYCPKCRGIWLDRGELDRILERFNTSDASVAESAPRKRKNDDYYAAFDDDDDDLYEGYERPRDPRRKHRKKEFLKEVFDLFD